MQVKRNEWISDGRDNVYLSQILILYIPQIKGPEVDVVMVLSADYYRTKETD